MVTQIVKLCMFSRNSYYVWKREARPIISLLEKYFTREDLQEFLEYGTIEKLEFANIQNYSVQAAEFLNVLNAVKRFVELYSQEEYQKLYEEYGRNEPDEFLGYISPFDDETLDENDDLLTSNETLDDLFELSKDSLYEMLYSNIIKDNEGLIYLALVFSEGKFESSEDFTVDNISQQIMNCYDMFVLKQGFGNRKIKSSSLGVFLEAFRKEYPKYPNYQEVLFNLYETNFVSLVRQCIRFHPRHAEIALWFCIQFNLYKYDSPLNINEVYRQVVDVVSYDPELGSSRFTIDIKKLQKLLKEIQNNK
ncbi:MAG: hypothetical protein PHN18_10280 [Sulfurospirillaceae bacterium]|nr:hypothetical protein [Sulfurospirillaceae bacterium]MDD2827474.1 hypothetical protein [Sulfurospirillaceae bacterium]